MEFAADKIPWVDNVRAFIHMAVRPLATVSLPLHVLGDQSPVIPIMAALICGTLAFTSRAARAGSRVTANLISPVESFSNIGLSITEHVIAITALYFVYNHPALL